MKKRLVKMLVSLTMAVIIAVMPVAVYANDTIRVTVDGRQVAFADQQPVIVDGRTLVPVRGVFEQMGFTVDWNDNTRQATLTRATDTVIITVGSSTFTTNGASYTLDVPAQLINDRTMLPIRAVLESVGYYLDWDGSVIISSTPITQQQPTPTDRETSLFGFNQARDFSGGLAAVSDSGNRWGFVNKSGELVVRHSYSQVTDFTDGVAFTLMPIMASQRMFDTNGNYTLLSWISTPNTIRFSEGLFAVQDGGGMTRQNGDPVGSNLWGFVDNTGQVVIPFMYDSVTLFEQGVAAVQLGNQGQLIDRSGNVIANLGNTDEIRLVEQNIIAVRSGNEWRLIDRSGNVITNLGNADEVRSIEQNIIAVRSGNEWRLIDRSGNVIANLGNSITRIDSFSYGRALVGFPERTTGTFFESSPDGFIDTSGNIVIEIPAAGGHANHFRDGLALLWRSGQTRFIDTSGNIAISHVNYNGANRMIYMAVDFYDGLAGVMLRINRAGEFTFTNWGVIDTSGNLVVSPVFDEAPIIQNGFARGRVNGELIVFDRNGNDVTAQNHLHLLYTPCDRRIASISEGMARVRDSDGSWGFVAMP